MAKTNNTSLRNRRAAVLVALLVFVGIVGVLALLFGRDVLAFLTDGRRVQEQVDRMGPLAPVVFGALVVIQEVTVLVPSEPLELAAGYAFGFWKGSLIYLAASVVGCIAIIAVVRFGGDRVLELILTSKRRAQLARLREAQKFDLAILVCFFIPGVPKDLMAYLAAFAGMRPVHLVAITTAGRLPSVLAVTLASSFAAAGDWRAAALVFGVTAVAVVVGVLLYHRFKRHHAKP
ncbi:TVP38/TMEM64 family protein [Eggerthella sinensis]|uniref:TVP38/TMEM64 family protein n=1 Tax=Eggerthella sinensis TaxID=242230 RepID=UPI001D05F977|nr:VTT domain-containing protein [Eggerthella sinensis]MCB7037643.1 VTT domain-containing protein [Eggerthella sinensis]